MSASTWTCKRCGACCGLKPIVEMVLPERGLEVGVFATPDERSLFPAEAIFPFHGYEKKPGNINVIAYQMVKTPCPHFDMGNNTCRIYKKRPMACRAYPAQMTSQGVVYIDPDCSGVKDVLAKGQNGKNTDEMSLTGLGYERDWSSKILQYQHKIFKKTTGKKRLIYDFKKKKWLPADEIFQKAKTK